MKTGQRRSEFLLFVFVLSVSLLVCEIALRLLTPFPVNEESNRVPDPVYGYRLSAELPDVNAEGFRNLDAAKKTLAAIGDSHTFGNNVDAKNAWPSVLADHLGVPVYNFGIGGFGVYSYHALARAALSKDSNGAIVAIYPANDFSERSHCPIDRDDSFGRAKFNAFR